MPPQPKHPSTRARRNKTSTNAVLTTDHQVVAPDLPEDIGWHSMTRAWWVDTWRSPMAPEYDDSDKHGLFMLAVLVNDFWLAEGQREKRDLAAEIRQQGQRFGLSPIDRRRLQWEIERSEDAQEKGSRRRAKAEPAKASSSGDPRSVLRAV
jgi:hypothetical protein